MPTRNAVCLCTDRNMLPPAMFVAASARRPASSDAVDVVVCTTPGVVDDAERLWMEERGILHCDTIDTSCLHDLGVQEERVTRVTLMKLLLAPHFADRYEKILYLDADVTLHDDVGRIFDLDTATRAAAAVPGGRRWPSWLQRERDEFHEHARALGMTAPYRFVNTGVMLVDIAKWNRAEVGSRALAFVRAKPELCSLPDEHALNAVLDGAVSEISPVWNMRPEVWRSERLRELAAPVVIHYAGPAKPWLAGRHREAFALYETFLRASPWSGWLEEQSSRGDGRGRLLAELRLLATRRRPTRRARRRDTEDFWRYCRTASFADVDQGIVVRDARGLRLAGRPITASGAVA